MELARHLRYSAHDSDDVFVILDVWVDESGETRVRINDNYSTKRTVSPDELRTRIEDGHYERREGWSYEEDRSRE